MNRLIILAASVIFLVAAGCNEQRFIKEKDGSEYKIIRDNKGKLAVAGEFMQVNILAKYKDSVLFSSVVSSAPRFIPYDTMQLPPYFKEVHEGDSLVIRQSTDSIMKSGGGAPFMEKGQYIYQSFKIVKLFPTKEAADIAAKPFEAAAKGVSYKKAVESIEKEIADNDSLVKADDKIITDFMAKNNLKGTKTPWGTYVVIETPGTGDNITQNDVAEVNYTGRTFNDSTFDSNTDKNFNHVEPLYVDMSEFRVIPGWIDGLKLMKKGSKGKIIIPSYLAYGKNGSPPKIAPNSNLIFDIEVTDIVGQDVYQKKMSEQQEEMQKQREMMQQEMQRQQQQQQPPAAPKGK
ncbi:MAG: FKBP-type peptidyl-prolyl cis-trans isomerase [Ginsengibacter sp.]